MDFFHEYYAKEKASKQRFINTILNDLEKVKEAEKLYDECWDMFEPITEFSFFIEAVQKDYIKVDINLKSDDSIRTGIDERVNVFEAELEANGFELNTDKTHHPENSNFFHFIYSRKNQEVDLSIYIGYSTKCKQVAKTELVTTYTTVCDDEIPL